MSKRKTLLILISLAIIIACLLSPESSKKTKNSSKAKKGVSLILETSSVYTTKIFGNEGPVLYIISWMHDGGTQMRMSMEELRIFLKSRRSRKVVMIVEGAASGRKIDHIDKWSLKTRELMQYAEREGLHIYGGEDMKLNRAGIGGIGVITREAHMMTDVEICTFFYGLQIVNKKRTGVLLQTLRNFKDASPDNLVFGMMGDDHFNQGDHNILESFATKHKVRIVLHYTKRASRSKISDAWPLKKCGTMKSFKRKFEKNIKRMAKGG